MTTTTLHVYREDGTEILPGDTITMTGTGGRLYKLLAATAESNGAGTGGMVAVDGYPDMFSAPFGLTVRAVPGPELRAWDARTLTEVRPGDTIRSLTTGQALTFRAAIRATEAGCDGMVSVGLVRGTGEREYPAGLFGLYVGIADATGWPVTKPAPEPSHRDLRAILADLDAADHRTRKARELRQELEDAVRAQLAQDGDAGELAAEADRIARTTAPPVPGVTVNPYTGHTVYAVIRVNHVPGEPSDDEWIVAAQNDQGGHVTWRAGVSNDGSGQLHYGAGHYHYPGEGADSEALTDLANRAGVFSRLTSLSSGPVTRQAFTESHAKVMDELSDCGVGRARVRAGLLEAAALGYARVSWHHSGMHQDYGISYDRVSCTFSWTRVYTS